MRKKGGGGGGKLGCGTEGANEVRWKGDEVQRKVKLTHALERLCEEAHEITLRASFEFQQLPTISKSIHVNESGDRISF